MQEHRKEACTSKVMEMDGGCYRQTTQPEVVYVLISMGRLSNVQASSLRVTGLLKASFTAKEAGNDYLYQYSHGNDISSD